ncbi:MAG: amino acid adenylation domain-containing protein [Pseudomonadota bacterium]
MTDAETHGPDTADSSAELDGIAVIGMALRFPGADSVDAYWRNLCAGVESISRFSTEELRAAGIAEEKIQDPNFVRARGLIEAPDAFDAAFFGYSARDAELMDPQQRLFLEYCWNALESSGYAPSRYPGAIGVWGGMSTGMENNTYLLSNLQGNPLANAPEDELPKMLGNENDYLTTRVSYKLDLRGPSVNVQSACSTSLVAITQAYQALLTYGCDMALAGGVSVSYPQVDGYVFQEGGIGSSDGHCRPFDQDAEGTVFSNGVGVVVLKRLEDAVADRDTVYAVIRGAALNNDGAAKMSFAAPSVEGQADAVATAQALADVEPATIGLIECHGTATPIGDPIEVAALRRAFGAAADGTGTCALGSVKSNFGHLDSAAGVAGFIKATLAVYHGQIPPTLHFRTPNPALELEHSPFFVPAELIDWPVTDTPRRAGVSAFGIGGTNAHVVLEQAQQQPRIAAPATGPARLLPIAAKTRNALNEAAAALADAMNQGDIDIDDVAYTLQQGREHFRYRQVIVAADRVSLAEQLEQGGKINPLSNKALGNPPAVAFLLPGGGSQYPDMGRGLYEQLPLVRELIDRGLDTFARFSDADLRSVWMPAPGQEAAAKTHFEQPSLQLPAIFILQVAIARQLEAWGVRPAALLGHSAGENTAAYLGGVMSYEAALGLVTLRGRLFETVREGGMLSIACSAEDASAFLSDHIDLAVVNGPEQCTLSGDRQSLEALTHALEEQDIDYKPVPIAIAAHSHLLDPILPEFRSYLEAQMLNAPTVPIVSNRTGQPLSDAVATNPDYWVQHLRNTVRFADDLAWLDQDDDRVFVELGPGRILSSLVRLQTRHDAGRVINACRHPADAMADEQQLLAAAGQLWTLGAELDWAALNTLDDARRIPLPTYRFQRQRFLIEAVAAAGTATTRTPLTDAGATAAAPQPESAAPPHDPTASAVAAASVRSTAEQGNTMNRTTLIEERIRVILHEMSGLAIEDIDPADTFLEMGFDSLFLTQANLRLKKEFKVKVTFRQLFDTAPTVAALASYIDGELPADALSDQLTATAPGPATGPSAEPAPETALQPPAGMQPPALMPAPEGNALHQAVALQLQANSALLAALSGTAVAPAALPNGQPARTDTVAPAAATPATEAPRPGSDFVPTVSRPAATGRFGPFKAIQKNLSEALTAEQERYLTEFIERYIARTGQSKAYTAEHRNHYADPRAVAGFKQAWKEITYPIVAKRSSGAYVYDVDGNEYVDCAGGFGATFFGHAPAFLMDAVRQQMDESVDYGPQSLLAGPTAKLICELTGMDRASFCNTGSEAVLAAMRIARTVTGNDLIVSFAGSYHGVFDEVLVKPQELGGQRVNKPVAPGIPESSSQNMVVLEYGDPASLEYLKTIVDDIAAVIIEPIQSRNPELQPVEFVRSVRALTQEHEVPLIFDEIITGFRLHPRGAQAWYDIDADICAYGKVIGGGMPVGVVAGKAQYMDTLDGGPWQYGDDSFPEAGVTYFAGTFIRHPTALAAVNAVMTHLQEAGPQLQADLNRRTALFCERVNRAYHAAGVPIEITYFASVMLPRFYGNPDFESLYFHHLRLHGAHIWEGRPGFLTTAHGATELDRLYDAFVAAAEDMQRAGFLPVPQPEAQASYDWTPTQSELWLALAMGEDARSAYNEQIIFEVDAALDAEVLELTLDKVVNRHPSLRSVVRADETGLVVRNYVRPEFEVVSLKSLDGTAQAAELRRLCTAHIDRNFDLQQGPLVRLLAIELDDDRSQLCLAASHLICDGWSLEVIMQDLAAFYAAMRDGRQIDRGTPPTMAEYQQALADRDLLGDVSDAEAYWRRVYEQPPVPADLPFDGPRPALKTYRGERYSFEVPASTAEALRERARRAACTPFVVTLAAYELLLQQLSGSNDLVIGIPAAGQPKLGMTDLVAHCVSFIPLRTSIDQSNSVEALLRAVRETFADAQDHQDFAFGDLLRAIELPRDPSRMPLITAAFNMDQEMSPLHFHQQQARFVTTPRGYVKYDLFFNLIDLGSGRGMDLEVDCNSDLLGTATAARWAELYVRLLELISKDPDATVSELLGQLPAAPAAARDGALIVGDAVDWPDPEATLVTLFEQAAATHRTATALCFEGRTISYQELDAQANQIGNWLMAQGAAARQPVAVVLDRSDCLVPALYGVLKAGAAYLPMDPGQPDSRLQEIIEQATPDVLLCQAADLPRMTAISAGTATLCLAVDGDNPAWSAVAATRPESAPGPDDPAYVIFTSGSTGLPKGVVNAHRGVVNRLLWAQREFQLDPSARVLQKTPCTFDVSVWELFWPLQVGAQLVLAQPEGHKDPRYLSEIMLEADITHVHFVPSMLGAYLADLPNHERVPDRLRTVICSGEALSGALRDGFFAAFPQVALYNLYGPTEAAIDVTAWRCSPEQRGASVPIGFAVANTQLLILDAGGAPVAAGQTGELYIGGVQVAEGYYGDPDRTAERFVELGAAFPGRYYRTGDLARQNANGALEHVGRTDSQIKLRGFRIELGDIEAKLMQLDGVRNAAVLLDTDSTGQGRLVAYVQMDENKVFSVIALRRGLGSRLPDYMIPQQFMELAQLPLTSSGKIDRRALNPAPGQGAVEHRGGQPETDAERRIADIWCRLLEIDSVTKDDYFFDLGGHSLNALSASREMSAALGYQYDLRDMLMNSLGQLAAQAESQASGSEPPAADDEAAQERSSRFGSIKKLFT